MSGAIPSRADATGTLEQFQGWRTVRELVEGHDFSRAAVWREVGLQPLREVAVVRLELVEKTNCCYFEERRRRGIAVLLTRARDDNKTDLLNKLREVLMGSSLRERYSTENAFAMVSHG
jgi:hypothetical protein